ncbi:MAG: PilZ domain-containing protein [Pseudomonadota bacterium]|nr:PilZ domain-containing protein [Pseudomonadota bacterium]
MDAYPSSWSSHQSGGCGPLTGELSAGRDFPAPSHKSRRSERVPVELGAGLRQRGASGVSVQIMDLSTDGFKAATHLELCPGTDVWLRLPGLEASHARVMWSQGHYVGCAFLRPLHPAVLDMIISKAKHR